MTPGRRVRRIAAAALGSVLLLACSPADEPRFPEFSAPVVDDADQVPDDVEAAVSAELEAFDRSSGRQVAVAVVDSTGEDSIEDWSIDLAREWGVGTEGDDDGVLLVIAYEDRRMRIEVGRGVEDELTDLEAGRIIREQLRPRLQDGDVGAAVVAGTQAIRAALGDGTAVPPPAPPTQGRPGTDGTGGLPWWIIPLGLVLLSGFGGMGRRRRGSWAGPMVLGGMMGGGWGRGGGGGGFGGFGGGGGGGFGGGGASGDW